MSMPIHWQLWLMLLLIANMIIPLFFLNRLEGQVVVGVFLASVILTTVLTGLSGFGRLLGLGHILWIPLLYFLWARLGQIPADPSDSCVGLLLAAKIRPADLPSHPPAQAPTDCRAEDLLPIPRRPLPPRCAR